MKVIHKWTLQQETAIDMPQDAKVLTVQEQTGYVRLWALLDPKAPTVRRWFQVYGTGQVVPDEPGRYVGTIQMDHGTLVFHVFEVSK